MSSSQNQTDDFVFCPHCNLRFKRRGLARHISCAHQNSNNGQIYDESSSQSDKNVPNHIETLFTQAFGKPMLNSVGVAQDSVWYSRWKNTMKFYGKQYTLPNGATGRQFVQLLTTEIQMVINGENDSEKIFFFCATVLQKDKMIVSGVDIRRLLQRRMNMWNNGNYDELLQEAIKCDTRFKSSQPKEDEDHKIRIFTRMVLQGKLRDATRWITDRSAGGVLKLNDILPDGTTVLHNLQSKHPKQQDPDPNMFLSSDQLPLMINVDVTANHVEKVARTLRGGAGPSGTDGEQWKSMLLRYGHHSLLLRESVASLTRLLSNSIVDWERIRALTARRGVALNKCPGVRPIGVGEVLQRLLAKLMALITGEDVQDVCGAKQLCGGTKAGIEGAIHGVTQLFNENEDHALLLMDASNAFNRINRPLALWNARLLWPRCARFLFNTYQGYSVIMFRHSDEEILSEEGTSQGDPLAMLLYAVAVLPLIEKLNSQDWIQTWYADDSSCLGRIEKVKQWLEFLIQEGPKWGYYPEPTKSVLVIKNPIDEDLDIFQQLGVNIVQSHKFLGSVIGSNESKEKFVDEKVKFWVEAVKNFGAAAKKSPQAAFAAFTKSLQFEWNFLQRVVDCSSEKYVCLRDAIQIHLIPAILGREISNIEHELLTLPTKLGGLAIKDPVKMAERSYQTSKKAVEKLVYCIEHKENLNVEEHRIHLKATLIEEKCLREKKEKEKCEQLLLSLPEKQKRNVKRVIDGNASHWLNVIPTSADHYDLSPTQFRDALALRYGQEISLPEHCDGCNEPMDVCHALNCKKGGLVKHGHDNLRDDGAEMAKLAFPSVSCEPVIREGNGLATPALIGDLKIVGLWESGRTAFLDYRIVNPDASSYLSQDWTTLSSKHAKEKHQKYDRAAEDVRSGFTPMVCSTDGVLHTEYKKVLCRIGSVLADKWKKSYSSVLNFLFVQTEFSIIRAVSMRLRGTRKLIRAMPWEDGAHI